MRRFDWGNGMRRVRRESVRRAGLALLAAFGFILASASAGPAAANSKYAAIVIDGKTGEVLFARKADYRRYPASLTKVMTLYMLFEQLAAEKTKLTDQVPMSKRCAGMPPSKLGIKAGQKISVEKAIEALVVRSANDVACAVGEKLGGSEFKFALEMTKKAKAIGMKRTKFRNASGLYNRGQVTTARDMATLGLRIQKDFPQYYHYFKRLKVSWNGRTWSTHNRLMKYFQGADGLKTGYIRASGFNLITSARRGNMHLVGVVLGGRKSRSRDRHMVSILERNFARLLKRDDYVYPIADRLPEIRSKPNFAAIDSRKWLAKNVGIVPRPNPFAPEPKPVFDDTAAAVLAELKDNQPPAKPEAAEKRTQIAQAGPRGGSGANSSVAAPDDGNAPEETDDGGEAGEPALPPLTASGPGAAPAGGGAPQKEAAPKAVEKAVAPLSVPARPPARAAKTQVAAIAPPVRGEDAAEMIEEGDGQIATDDLAGQLPAPEESGDAAKGAVRIASGGPAASRLGASVLAPARLWGVQLGAFTTVELAETHLDNAERLYPDVLTREKSALLPKDDSSGELYRARFGPLDEAEAKTVCDNLRKGGMHCFALETDDWGEAVRR